MFKICSVGCGQMAENGHGPAFQKYKETHPDTQLAACCDIDAARAESFAKRFGFEKYYTDFKKMIMDIRPDAVSLICPVHLTATLAKEIMRLGCNVIMEKPPAENRAEIEELIRVAKETGVHVRTAFNRRYTPLITELKKRIERTGERVTNITYQMYRYKRHERDFSTTAIHAVDAVKYIVGSDYREVAFNYDHRPELGENVKNIFMNARFENGAVAQISLVPTGGAVIERLSANTLNHSFFVDIPVWDNMDVPGMLTEVSGASVERVSSASLSSSVEMFELTGFYDENRSFFDLIKEDKAQSCDLESAIQSVEIEDCIRNSEPSYKK